MSARELLQRYEVEINKHDFTLLRDLISKDCTFWFSSGSFRGLNEVQAAFENTWRQIQDEVYSISDLKWLAEDQSTATCIYTFNWKGLVDGKLAEGSGRGTSCFRTEGSSWKIVHEHLSRFPV